jgi:L,D-transpeptidase YcbB
LLKFYEIRQNKISWSPAQAEVMIQAIEAAKDRGLNPDDYHRKVITLSNTVQQDVLLSDAFLHLAHHLTNGKTKPPASWKLKRAAVDFADLLDRALSSEDLSAILFSVEPQNIQYQELIHAIRNYRLIASHGGWKALPEGPRLQNGIIGKDVSALRDRLRITGDFLGEAKDELIFDEVMEEALRNFQKSHGLNPDGIVGQATREQLNMPVQKRIRQLEVNLDRMRWIPDDLGERYIQINIAAFELTAFVKDSQWFTMKIIAGKPDWQSPTFLSSEITYLETNPYWYVPSEIAKKEIWPKANKNEDYLKINRMKIIKRPDGAKALRQSPGPHNSLGRIKIHFANEAACYLHDTPEKKLFDKAERAFSHGCIRLENALEVSNFLLLGDAEWDQERLQQVVDDGLQKKIYLSDPVPIYIVYLTAWGDDSGTIQFRKDIYGMD